MPSGSNGLGFFCEKCGKSTVSMAHDRSLIYESNYTKGSPLNEKLLMRIVALQESFPTPPIDPKHVHWSSRRVRFSEKTSGGLGLADEDVKPRIGDPFDPGTSHEIIDNDLLRNSIRDELSHSSVR